MACIVCGQENCQENFISGIITKRNPNEPPRKPVQQTTIGVPGYNKPVRLYDPHYPHVNFVPEEDEEEVVVEEVVEVTRRVRTVEDANAALGHDPKDS